MSTIRKAEEISVAINHNLDAVTRVLTVVTLSDIQILACRSYRTSTGNTLLMDEGGLRAD